MPAISLLSGLAFILLFTMVCTSPSWIAGRVTARKKPHKSFPLTMPGRGNSLIRWALLLTLGFTALTFFSVATGFNSAHNFAPVIMAGFVSAAAAGASQYIAFAIGHTKASTALLRQQFEADHEEPQATEPGPGEATEMQEVPATQTLPVTPAVTAPPAPTAHPAGGAPIQPGIPGWT